MAGINKYLGIALSIVFALVGLVMVLNVSGSIIPTASTAYYDLATTYNASVVGTGPAALATSSVDWMGYLWVILPFALAVGLIVMAFKSR